MEKKYSRKYIGRVFRNTEKLGNYKIKVIDGSNRRGYCTIQIEEWVKEVFVGNLKIGNVKYPYHRRIFGIGYLGECSPSKNKKAYSTWCGMIRRCYDESHLYSKTYIGCSVSDKWHNFEVFVEWFDQNYTQGWHLDKDLLIDGNNVYSENACVFIPPHLNTFIATKQSNNVSGHVGVSWDTNRSKWIVSIRNPISRKDKHLGRFDNILEASETYKIAREGMAERMRVIMITKYDITDKRIIDAIR